MRRTGQEKGRGKVDTLAEKVTEWQVNTVGELLFVVDIDAQLRH